MIETKTSDYVTVLADIKNGKTRLNISGPLAIECLKGLKEKYKKEELSKNISNESQQIAESLMNSILLARREYDNNPKDTRYIYATNGNNKMVDVINLSALNRLSNETASELSLLLDGKSDESNVITDFANDNGIKIFNGSEELANEILG